MKYLLLCLLLGAGGAVYAEPEDSITVVVSAEDSDQLVLLVDVPDSSYAVPYKVVYEEVKGINTVVYSWVAEMPRFVLEGAGTVAHADAFDEYVREYELYDHILDTTFHATYDAVIERDGSVSNLQRVDGNGTTAFHNKVEHMLLDMPRWRPGYHKDAAQRVWVRLNICHPNSSGESRIEFVGKPRMTKQEVEQPKQTIITRIPAKATVQKQFPLRRKTFNRGIAGRRVVTRKEPITMSASWHFGSHNRIGYEWYKLTVDNPTDKDITILPEFAVDTVMSGKRAMLFCSQTDSAVTIPHGTSRTYDMNFKRNNKFRGEPMEREYILCLDYTVAGDTTRKALEAKIKRPIEWREGRYYYHSAYTIRNGRVVILYSDDLYIFPREGEDEYEDIAPTTQASFPGGYRAFNRFFETNVNPSFRKGGKRVGLSLLFKFNVDQEGNISDVELDKDYLFMANANRKTVPRSFIDEAMRIINLMPKWRPATVWGEPVESSASLRLSF